MIRAYPGRPSVQAGDTLQLHVAGDEARFRIAIYRWEDGLRPVWRGDRLQAERLLAACPLDRRWQELPPRERHGAGEGIHVAAMGMFRHGGTVFSAGTTDWARVLGDARDRRIDRITRNVLERLSRA